MGQLKGENVKNIIKKCKCVYTYIFTLLILLVGLFYLSVLIYVFAKGDSLTVYVSNILLILWVLFEEKLENQLLEKWYYKSKDGGFVKRCVKKLLISAMYKPSLKVALYTYYMICIAADRLLYFGVLDGIVETDIIDGYHNLLSMMYYSFIFLMALDKVRTAMSKEHKHRKQYYARFEGE